MSTYLKGLEIGADVYRLSDELYRSDAAGWKKFERSGHVPLDKDSISIDVKVKLESGGISKVRSTKRD
ncbi:hypothetical protein [Paenibacillus thermotolerans]|uniref:hypothetical protein n=1 Tax=Paenibacillus thermotolerans TaxID=3027807 RepID=UPI002368C236|nr:MULTISPECIES: hypothetical protein [unclassified Paenibacillus]